MSSPPTISVGDTLSGRLPNTVFRLVEQLGVGGVGAVYRAVHETSGQSFAIKVLHRVHHHSDALRRRFEREAQALEALDHPNIVKITDHGAAGSEPYLVMELLVGESLAERLRREPLSETEVRRYAGQLLAALSYVHEHGLVHRDLKPGNVFLARDADGGVCVKVLDFGFAKFLGAGAGGDARSPDPLTRSGEIFGTPAYMAPEQIGSQETNATTDVYALGVLLYEMVTTQRPFDGDVTDIMRGHLVEAPPPLTTARPGLEPAAGLAALIARALHKRPAERFADATQMQAAFAALPSPLFTSRDGATEAFAEQSTLFEPGPAAEPGRPTPARSRSSPLDAIRGFLGAAFFRAVRASAMALIVVSLAVILVSAIALYALRDTDGGSGVPSPKAIASRLQQTLGRAGFGAAHAPAAAPERPPSDAPGQAPKGATGEAPTGAADETPAGGPRPADAAQETLAAAPPQTPSGAPDAAVQASEQAPQAAVSAAPSDPERGLAPGAPSPTTPSTEDGSVAASQRKPENGTEAGTAVAAAERPRAHNPWRRQVPRSLRKILRAARAGHRGNEAMIRSLRGYNREHPRDARGHLLLAQLYWNRNWHDDALIQYEFVAKIDPSARAAPPMLPHLLELAGSPKTRRRAGDLISALYGREALAALADAIKERADDQEASAALSALQTRLMR